jgi:hypothetical protein
MGGNLMSTLEPTFDPLLSAIGSFKLGMATYDAHPGAGTDDDDAIVEATYGPALRALQQWSVPAMTRASALAALELANEDLDHSMDHALISAMVKASYGFFRNEGTSKASADLTATISASVGAVDRHTHMEALYDGLAHLSDALSGLVSRPRMGEEGPGAAALEALDDFLMDQMDAVKNRALAVPPAGWPDHQAKFALMMKHVARFRTDTTELELVASQIVAGLEAIEPDV